MTNLAYLVVTLFTNTPTTNFLPSGYMEVEYRVQKQCVTVSTNDGKAIQFTNHLPAFTTAFQYQRSIEWKPITSDNPAYVSPPPLPLPK